MSLEKRIEKLENLLNAHLVRWKLKDGTEVKAESHEIHNCFYSLLFFDGRTDTLHPLAEKIKEADPSTYTGGGKFFDAVYRWMNEPATH